MNHLTYHGIRHVTLTVYTTSTLKLEKERQTERERDTLGGMGKLNLQVRHFSQLHNELNISTGRICLCLPLLKLADFTCSEGLV